MQFKKTFSSNLQNLSIKKTLVLNPPVKLLNTNPSQQQISRKCNFSPIHLTRQSEANQQNKQNLKDQSIMSQFNKNSRLKDFNDGKKLKPETTLTFNKLKRNNVQMIEEVEQRRMAFVPQVSRRQTSHKLLANNLQRDHFNNINNHSNVRCGSMVFASLSKHQAREKSQKNKIFQRESRSFDRLGMLSADRKEQNIQCINNDGRYAKYKVVKNDYQECQLLYYCFNCAICLVKQGFVIEQLTMEDRKRLNLRTSNYMSKSDFYSGNQEISRCSHNQRPLIPNDKIKIGEQIKCKIIMRLNKLKVGREQLNKTIQNNLQNIDYFYNSLTSYIEQQRVSDRQQMIRIKNFRKCEPENYESKLSSSLGTVDYMIRNLQGVNHQFIEEVNDILENEVIYPKMKINIEPKEGFQGKLQNFMSYFEKNIKINLEEERFEESFSRNRRTSQTEQSIERNNPLRFSFEEALEQSKKRKFFMRQQMMNPLYEQNESQLEQSLPIIEQRQNAFRNLFPQENSEQQQENQRKESPVFKQF